MSILVPLFIFWIDPYFQWHRRTATPGRELARTEAWRTDNLNENVRDFKISQIQQRSSMDVLLLGSSRLQRHANASMFQAPLRIYNAAVYRASLWDYIAQWQAAKESRHIPRYVIIYLDPWQLNATFESELWRRHQQLVRRFMPLPPHRLSNGERSVRILREVLNFEMLNAALRECVRRFNDKGPESRIIPWEAIPDGVTAYLSDGSNLVNPSASQTISQELAQRRALRDAKPKTNFDVIYSWELDQQAVERLDALITEIGREHAQVMIILPPFHPDTLKIWLSHENSKKTFTEFRRVANESVAGKPYAHTCDRTDPRDAQCNARDFEDGLHMRPGKCARQVLASCLNSSPEWNSLLADDLRGVSTDLGSR